MSNRIYGTRTDINEQEVRDFYNKRAALASSMKNPLSAVVNGEQNPEQADTRSRFDREYIVPRLDLTQNSAVLDIGCGMGRFAEMVLPLCGRYLGADFAPEMIAAAEKRTAAYSDQAKYVCASFSELMSKPDSFFGGKFDCVIMLGVCMYINDTELVKCLTRLVDLLNDKCVMYVGDAVGLGTRLTLDQIHSDQLDSDYSAIYRTAEEYVKLYSIFTKQGFHFAEQAYFPPEINGTRYNDSDRWYAIRKR